MPDPLSIIRLAALLAFIGLVAVGLWLLDVAWWVVPPVMALALVIAWTIEWLAWRGTLTTSVIREATAPAATTAAPPPPAEEPPPPAEAIAPVAPAAPAPPPPRPAPSPAPEPPPAAQEPPRPEPPPPPPEPEPEPPPPPEPEPEPEPVAQAEPPSAPPPPAAPAPEPPPQPAPPPEPTQERRLRRPRRMRLRPVPAPVQEQQPVAPAESPQEGPVVAFRPRSTAPRSWNLWDLERIARESVRVEPERRDEWAYLFLHLRQFASADGSLPLEFDGLVRESFGGLLERAPGA